MLVFHVELGNWRWKVWHVKDACQIACGIFLKSQKKNLNYFSFFTARFMLDRWKQQSI